MKFEFDFDKIKAAGIQCAEKGVDLANDLADRAQKKAQLLNDQNKLSKAQRELGALVYSLAKNGENNQPLLDKYIDAISALEQEIEQLQSSETPAYEPVEEDIEVEVVEDYTETPAEPVAPAAPVEEQAPAKAFCPQCGAPAAADALFCNRCGAQLQNK